jgi:tetratricopeptide (TPR) repeat protein
LEEFVLKMNPSPDMHEKRILARMWATSGPSGLSRALELQSQAVQECTSDNLLKSQLLLDLGNYYLSGQQYEPAATAYEAAIKADPNNVEALNNLAFVAADELKQPQRALEPATRAAQLRPDNAAVLDTEGWVNFLVGNNDKAKACLRQSLLKDESSSPTYLHMAHVLFKAGDKQEALEHLKRALELKPDASTKKQIDELQEQVKNAK